MSDATAAEYSGSTGRRPARKRAAAVLASLALLAGSAAGCGNAITVVTIGQAGVSVDSAGEPVITVFTCATQKPVITMFEGRKPSDPDDKENVQRGEWASRSGFAGVRQFSVSDPGPDWVVGQAPGTLESDRLFIVDGATNEDENASLIPVNFRTSDLAGLTPDQVLVKEGQRESLTEFGAFKCP